MSETATITPPAATTPPPVTPAVPAVPPTPDPAVATAAEVRGNAVDRIFQGLSGRKMKTDKPAEPAKPAPDPTVAPAKPTPDPIPVPAADDEPAKKKTRTRHVLTKEAPDAEEIADIAAQAAVKVVNQSRTEAAPAPAPVVKPVELPEMFSDRARVWEMLEAMNPEKYGNGKLVKQLAVSAKKIADYQSTWEAQNPGQRFEPDDHEEEIDRMSPDIPERDLVRAEIKLELKQELEQELKPLRKQAKETEEQRTVERLRDQVRPEMEKATMEVADSIFEAVDPELAKVIKSGKRDQLDEYAKNNEHLFGVAIAAHRAWTPIAERVAALMSSGGYQLYDKNSKLDVHIRENVIPGLQKALVGQQNEAGQTFSMIEEYMAMTPRQQAKHFVLTKELAIQAIRDHASGEAKNALAEQEKLVESVLKRRGVKPNANPDSHSANGNPLKINPPANNTQASGIAAPGSGPAVSGGAGGSTPQLSAREKLLRNLTGGRV